MNRTLVLLSVLILVGAVAGGHRFLQWSEKEKAARATELARQHRQKTRDNQDKLVSEAAAWLDEWSGQGDQLSKAAENLQTVLIVNRRNVRARIEMARLHIRAGHINYRNFRPGTIENAERELRIALQLQTDSADAHVLLGHVFYLSYRSREALPILEKAEAIGTNNPWLHLNWADVLMDLYRWSEAESRLRKAQTQYAALTNLPRNAVRSLHEKRAMVLANQRKLDEADKAYQAMIAFDPTYAWGRGNYAEFLLFTRGMPDAAIAEAEKTLQIMNYGIARLTLAAARYAKWAEVKHQSPAQAAQYLALAEASEPDFSWIMPLAAKSVSAGPAIQSLVKELVALGVPLDTKDEHGVTGLTLAALAGNLESVPLLIKLGANIEATVNSGQTALAAATNRGHIEMVKALASHGANVNSQDEVGRTPLFVATFNEDKEMIRTLLSLKADVNIALSNGSTPLMSAAFRGNEDLVRILLQAGADSSRQLTNTQQTAADLAMSQGHTALAGFIREAAEKRRAIRR